jgi:16S rRNA (guanine966-N2)-methyltransferase
VGSKVPTHARGDSARQLRIIAGRWRGRRWRFPDTALRPTPDRVRETLFNWLQPWIAGRRCLDLFAGSGALSLEALSRGASHACALECDAQAAAAISATAREFGATGLEIHCVDALEYLRRRVPAGTDGYGLVFVDPPFDAGLMAPALQLLDSHGWLAPGALVYVEQARAGVVPVPPGWQQLKSGTAGAVGYHLYRSAGA